MNFDSDLKTNTWQKILDQPKSLNKSRKSGRNFAKNFPRKIDFPTDTFYMFNVHKRTLIWRLPKIVMKRTGNKLFLIFSEVK